MLLREEHGCAAAILKYVSCVYSEHTQSCSYLHLLAAYILYVLNIYFIFLFSMSTYVCSYLNASLFTLKCIILNPLKVDYMFPLKLSHG